MLRRLPVRLAPTRARASSTVAAAPFKTAVFFPGHGVQRVGMLEPWIDAFPTTARPILEQMDHILGPNRPKGQPKLSEIISNGPNSLLAKTENSQPAIMTASVLILRILEKEFGLDFQQSVDYTLGHSLGEFAALVAGGYFSFEDGLWLIQKRAIAMAEATAKATSAMRGEETGMVALVCEDEDRLYDLLADLSSFVTVSSALAGIPQPKPETPPLEDDSREALSQLVQIGNINSKTQLVLSGSISRIKALVANLRQFGGHDPRAVRLSTDAPFHSQIMQPACTVLREILSQHPHMVNFPDPEDETKAKKVVPCISNITARPFWSTAQLRDLLARQCVETVHWWASVQYLDRQCNVRRWIGIGPGKVGRNLVGKEVGYTGSGAGRGEGVWAITSPQEAEETMKAWER